MSGYIGPSPVPQSIQRRQSFTATAGQTTFGTTGYTDGDFIDVYLNGVKLVGGTDYTATNGSDIVLTSAASASDVLDFVTFNSLSLANHTFDDSITLQNATEEDTDGGRETTIIFKGEQSGGEISTLAEIEASHDGTADDEKGDLIFRTNDGSDGSSPTERMRVDSAGNVGIGTNNPADVLHVKGEGQITVEDTSSGNIGEVYVSNSALQLSADPSGSIASSSIVMRVDGLEKMRVDADGNVGIGTSNPASIVSGTDTSPVLSIGGTDSVLTSGDKSGAVSFVTNDSSYLATYSDGVTSEIASVAQSGTGAAYALAFYTGTITSSNRSERLRILPAGGITFNGDTATANALDDYEQGTWTVQVNTGVTLTASSAASGIYTKIGRMVFASCLITPSAVTSSSTYFDVKNLPFTANSNSYAFGGGSAMSQHAMSSAQQLVPFIGNGNDYIRFYQCDGGAWDRLQHSDLSTSTDMYVTVNYYV